MRRRKKIKYDSKYEQAIVKDYEDRGLKHITYHPRSFGYHSKIRSGRCNSCGTADVVKGRSYTPDFKLGQGEVYLESKGKLTSSNRTDLRQFVEQFRGKVELRFLFMRDNWLTKQHKTRYSEWAESIGCKWAVGAAIPKEWEVELGLGS